MDSKMCLRETFRTGMIRSLTTLFIQILTGNIILRHLMRANFPLVSVLGVFDALYHVGLERVSFLEQLVHTLRIRTFDVGQSLQISRLLARPRSRSLQCECHRIHALTFPPNLFLKCARRFPAGCLLTADLRLQLALFRSCILLGQHLLGSCPLLSRLLPKRLLHRGHLLARSSLRLRLLLLGFLFGSHTRSLPPFGHSYCLRMPPLSTVAVIWTRYSYTWNRPRKLPGRCPIMRPIHSNISRVSPPLPKPITTRGFINMYPANFPSDG